MAESKDAEAWNSERLSTIKLYVRDDLARAFQRCTWAVQEETGRGRLELMEEMVTDFLRRYGC